MDSHNEEAYYYRGISKSDKGDKDAAILDFSKAIELKPDYLDAYDSRGSAKDDKGDFDGAILDFNKAIEIDPKDPAAYLNRAASKWNKGDSTGSISDYTRAIDASPKEAPAYHYRACKKQAMGDLAGAIADFSQAIALDQKYADAYCRRGSAKEGMGNYDGAAADCTSAIEISPKDPSAYEMRGYIHYDARKFADALSDFRKVIELDQSNSVTSEYSRFRIWLIRSRQGDEKAATEELLKYLVIRKPADPPDWQASVLRFLVGQLPEPEFFASAKNADPKKESEHLCEAYFYSGSRYLFSGNAQVASGLFKKCIATAGDHRDFCEYMSALAEVKVLGSQVK